MIKKPREKKKTWAFNIIFLISVVFLYLVVYTMDQKSVFQAIEHAFDILLTLAPILLLVFIFMIVFNYYLKPKTVTKYLGSKAGWKGWMFATVIGIFSHGSIYIWYPLLKQLHQKGMSFGFIAVFLYNRAIKIPLIPAIVLYFGVTYTLVLFCVMIVAGLIQGKIIDLIMNHSLASTQ